MPNETRGATRVARYALAALLAVPAIGFGVSGKIGRKDPVLTTRHLNAGASIKVFNAAGSVRLIGWSHDSIEVHGAVSPRSAYFAVGDVRGMKIGVDDPRPGEQVPHGDIAIYLPRGTQVSVKTVNGDIDASDVSGWLYTVAGAVHVSGTAATMEVEDMRGDVDLNATVPWLRARGGAGRMTVRGAVRDADVSTISGALDVPGGGIIRGQFASVSGDIRWAGAPAVGAILDFSNHSGTVDLALTRGASGAFTLSTIEGTIANAFAQVRPVSQEQRSAHFRIGSGGGDIAVRTFKGAIRLHQQ
jgi:DUF4097 and DUF4098 domain-containing protein YvlB